MWWWTLSALAAAPDVTIAYERDRVWLEVEPPEGTVVDDVPPLVLWLGFGEQSYEVATNGHDLSDDGVALRDLRGAEVKGTLQLALCAKADGTCTMTEWELAGTVGQGKRGRTALAVSPPLVVSHDAPEVFNADASEAIRQGFARAEAEGKPVLLDFSAVWCPPCNLLSAEVLHAEPPPAVLEDYVVIVVDVDHPSSFELKSRYDIGGYPTVVVADADGAERSRRVGYAGRDAFVGWLAKAGASTDAADLAKGAETVSPERALELAWMLLADRRNEEAAPFVERGAEVDNALARRVRATMEPTEGDLRWLLDHDLEHVEDWFGAAMGLAEAHPELSAEVAAEAVRRLDGPLLADALYVQAKVTGDEGLYAAAASALRTALSGVPDKDRGHLTWLASLTALSGDVDGALAILDDARARWPDEPTWDLSAAYELSKVERHEDALAAAERAAATAWGDNALRAAHARAEALLALGREEEAVEVVQEALQTPAPEEGVAVRTHRYRERLAGLLEAE